MPILNGMASWPERVESEVVEQKIKPAGKKMANTNARMPTSTCACVGVRAGVRECACVGFLFFCFSRRKWRESLRQKRLLCISHGSSG